MTQVQILLATHNGAPFLKEQLQSYATQSFQDWALWVSDDASTDTTPDILQAFCKAHPNRNIRCFEGPNQGLFANFIHLLRHPEVPAGYVALSDQDDVWLPHRLSRAVQALRHQSGPAFYCSTRITTDAFLQPISRKRPQPLPPPSFQNALLQNIAAGNTMMLNPYAMALLRKDPQPPWNLRYHDWWIYLRLMAAGATLICDPEPSLLYRQHNNNFLGHRKAQKLLRLRALLDGSYRSWIEGNMEALLRLPPHTIHPLYRQAAKTLLTEAPRWQALRKSGAQRSDWTGRMILPILAILNRI